MKFKIVAHELIKWLTTPSLPIPFACQILIVNVKNINIHFKQPLRVCRRLSGSRVVTQSDFHVEIERGRGEEEQQKCSVSGGWSWHRSPFLDFPCFFQFLEFIFCLLKLSLECRISM